MNLRARRAALGLCIAISPLLITPRATAGVYSGIIFCDQDIGTCFARGLLSIAPNGQPYPTQPFGIVHPLGYNGTGGEIRIRVCVGAGEENERLVLPAARAIFTWNQLVRSTGNCSGCKLWEDIQPVGEFHAETTILHELGHCAMGLGHPNLELEVPNEDGILDSSYTAAMHSARAGLSPGGDAIRGSFDDEHLPFPMEALHGVHYFRASDNDPVIIDSTVIDTTTYIRTQGDLPAGHEWAASANKNVAAALGAPDTQSVMYSLTAAGAQYSGLTADEVNMVELGMRGLDGLVGGGDDYTVVLELEESCGGSDILVVFGETSVPLAAADCQGYALDFSDGTPSVFDRHYSIVPFQVLPLLLRLNSDLDWDTGGPDLRMEIIVIGAIPGPGDPIEYSVAVENAGNGDATGVVVTTAVPAGTTFDAGESDPAWNCSAGLLASAGAGSVCTLSVGSVPSMGEAGPWTFTVVVDDPTIVADVVGSASVADDGTNGPDENSEDNSATVSTAVDVPCGGMQDLVLTASDPELLVLHEACNSISAGTAYVVGLAQDVTFKARNSISLGAVFRVETGGVFKAQIDPLAGQLP